MVKISVLWAIKNLYIITGKTLIIKNAIKNYLKNNYFIEFS